MKKTKIPKIRSKSKSVDEKAQRPTDEQILTIVNEDLKRHEKTWKALS